MGVPKAHANVAGSSDGPKHGRKNGRVGRVACLRAEERVSPEVKVTRRSQVNHLMGARMHVTDADVRDIGLATVVSPDA